MDQNKTEKQTILLAPERFSERIRMKAPFWQSLSIEKHNNKAPAGHFVNKKSRLFQP
jgi:hypothetical protein